MNEQDYIRATHYIKSGYFPKANNYFAIIPLREEFNKFSDEIKIGWLYDFSTSLNAEKLFRILYSDVYVEDLYKQVSNIRNLEYKKSKLAGDIAHMKQELDEISVEIINRKKSMEGHLYD